MIEDIDFADDICLLSQSHNDMQQKTNDLRRLSWFQNQRIQDQGNANEQQIQRTDNCPLGAIEAVNDFIYLGSKMQADGDSEPDVKRRISKASQAFSMLKIMEIKETQQQHQDPYLQIKCRRCSPLRM